MARFDFQDLVERLPLVVYVDQLDEKSSPLYISPQIAQLMGYSEEEWLADPDLFTNSLHPEDRERVLADIVDRNAGLTGSTTMYLNYRLIARDGRVVWIRDDEVVVLDAEGRPAAAHGYMQDVTDRQRDSIRLELLVGILSLAADETPPDEIVAHAAERLVEFFGDVQVSYVERRDENSFYIRYTTHPGEQEFGDEVEWSADYIGRLEDGAPIVVEDVVQEAWLDPIRDLLVQRDVASFVDVPLFRNGTLTGVLWFNSARARTWGEHEVSVLVDVAGQLAVVLANAEAREERLQAELDLRNRDAILEAVSRSAESFLKQPVLDEALADLMRVLGEATAASGAFVFENVAGKGAVPLSFRRAGWAAAEISYVDDPRLGHLQPAPHFARWAALLAAGEAISSHVRDLPDDERETLELIDALSVVAVPIFVDGVWWGFIGFEDCERERDWSSAETDALRAAAGLVAAAVNRERAERDLRRRDAILEAVSHGARQLVAAPSWRDAAPNFMRELGEASRASRCYLFENAVDSEGELVSCERFEWVAEGIAPQIGSPVLQALNFEKLGLMDFAVRVRRDEIVSANTRDLPDRERAFFESGDVRSVVTVPIFADGEWWGFIGFDDCVAEREWSPAKIDALRTAASLVGAAIERERAERDLRRRDAILEAVSRSAQRLLAEPNWRDAADELLERLGVAAEASRAYVFEHRVRSDGVPIAVPLFEWVADGIAPESDEPLLQEVCFVENGLVRHWEMFNRNEAVAGNIADFPEQERVLIGSQDTLSIINLPIFVGDNCWGFIGLDDCVSEREWSAAETDALRTAASLVAAAIGREHAEAILREHEQKLRAVFDTALDAIFITDDDRRYVDVNPAGCDLIGVSKRDLIGRRLDEFLPPQRLEHVVETWDRYIEGGPVREEWETMRPDGIVVVAEASARPNFVPGLHIAFLRDITDRKRLESELVNSQKLESLGRLAGGVAHDFNNLLTGITGYASLLLERANGDTELTRDLGEIKRAADRAAELTKQLLAFGRRQVLKPRPLDLNTVLAEVGGLLQRLLGDQVELELLPAPELGTVRADPGQIEHVIVNLAVNASNAMPHGGRLSIETRNAGDGSVELVVADTGIGMDEQTLSQIFEPFFTTRDQGVGLGLASVHGIVHQSGGEVTVQSTPGAGSVFTVRLPRILEPAAEIAAAPEPASRPGSETILLVEDEDVVRELTRRVLQRQGYTVLACADGEEAIALSESDDRTIHLLLTDVVMPGLRGYEVARIVAATRPEMKILYMSGYAEETLVGRPALAASALIEKPFAVDALARRVREALEAA